jgi:hypothetical protein
MHYIELSLLGMHVTTQSLALTATERVKLARDDKIMNYGKVKLTLAC